MADGAPGVFEATFEELELVFPYETNKDLLDHCKSLSVLIVEYYNKLFNEEGGDNFNMRRAAKACNLFYPVSVHGLVIDINHLYGLSDDLKYSGYQPFSYDLLILLKREIPILVQLYSFPFDWGSIEATQKFTTRLQKLMKLYNLVGLPIDIWRDNPGKINAHMGIVARKSTETNSQVSCI